MGWKDSLAVKVLDMQSEAPETHWKCWMDMPACLKFQPVKAKAGSPKQTG